MNHKFLVGTTAALSACALAWAASDQVVMTVNGVDVPRSEFEYLYHKNRQQQLDPQTIDEYAEMFKLYKLKVADAIAEGLDTTQSFRKEMEQYRNELSAPYLADSTLLLKLVETEALRGQTEAEVFHIMMMKTPDWAGRVKAQATLDSIRGLLLNGADFGQLAYDNSQDRSAKNNRGRLGFITVGKLPYNFESVAYDLPEGEVSEIVESPMGYHIILGGKKRPARGFVQASHIMRLVPQGSTPEQEAEIKAQIDSLYQVALAEPNRFPELAQRFSDDKGSARNGGALPLFGAGEMVPEFDSVAFAIPVGAISEPVRTAYGWHIIQKTGVKPPKTAAEMKPELLSRMSNPQDDRYKTIMKSRIERLSAKHKGRLNEKNLDVMRQAIRQNGIDSIFYDRFDNAPEGDLPIATIGKRSVKASELAAAMRHNRQSDPGLAEYVFNGFLDIFFDKELVKAEQEWLAQNEPEYRNLLNEYRDGTLLYDVSVNKVWDRASKDTEGLARFFNEHRGDYTWQEPHAKGILVQTVNDSVADLIRARMAQLGNDTVMSTIRREFPKEVQLERVLVTKGANPMVDNLMFGGPEVKPSVARYNVYFLYDGRMLNRPETYEDVRGLVTNDYQDLLEKQWTDELKAKYPVKINEKVLKKIK